MCALAIKIPGVEPAHDGDLNLYESEELGKKDWFDHQRKVIFVNGMANSPENHRVSADGLSTLQCCPVLGLFNQSGGAFKDLWQCLRDKLKFSLVTHGQSSDFDQWDTLVQAEFMLVKAVQPMISKAAYVSSGLTNNKATSVMFDVLRDPAWKKAPIFAHSQGNLITSNALTAVALVDGKSAIQGREVYSYGSPSLNWPPGIKHYNHAFTFDPVGWLDYRFAFSNVKVGFKVAHSFDTYRQFDPEFVVNRFRWGSFGLTANMDEDGLAQAMVEMGVNPSRLQGIFERLLKRHNSDADDVALLYVQKMRKSGRENQLKFIATENKKVIQLMIECLTGGTFSWVSGEEEQAAQFLKGLI